MVLSNEEQLNMITFALKEKEVSEFKAKIRDLDIKELNKLKKDTEQAIKSGMETTIKEE